MDDVNVARFVFAFIFVISLIALLAWALKRYGKTQAVFGQKPGEGRLSLVEMRYLDPRRKLVLVKRDDREHLLLLADGRELVIESNIINGKMGND